MRKTPWILAAVLAAGLLVPPASAQDAPADAIAVDADSTLLAPGVALDSYDRWEDQGWLRADAVTVDLAGAHPEYLSPGSVAAAAPVREQAAGIDDVVLAFNADFFDINDTGGPEGVVVVDGELVKSADAGTANVLGFDADGRAAIRSIGFTGTADTGSRVLDLHGLNTTELPRDGIGVYDADWGEASRARVADGAAEVVEVHLVEGTVTAVTDAPEAGPIAEDAITLVGREAGAQALAALAVGDRVAVAYAPVLDGELPRTGVSGRQILIRDGAIVPHADQARHPRTAVGLSEDGTTLYAVTVDGRQAASGGYTLDEVAAELLEMGAHSAINLDGGGSSTLLARAPGTDDLLAVNSPSDGTERAVGNGLAFTVPAGDGTAAGFAVAPQGPFAPGAIDGLDYDRVFPGLSRPLAWAAHDATFAPAEATPRWRTTGGSRVDGDAVFHAGWRSGTVEVHARSGRAAGSTELTVLGPLRTVAPSQRLLALPDAAATATFQLIGADADGFTAPIDPVDIALDYDRDLLTVAPDGLGGFTVTAKRDSGSGVVTLTVGGRTASLAVTVGLTERPVADFTDAAQWTFSAARATGSAAPATGYEGDGLALSYDFTQSTATRAAYVRPPANIAVEGQPQRFGMWIKAQGDGEWPSLHLKDADGTDVVLRGAHLEDEGWQWVEFDVPEGTNHPVSVYRFYVAETKATAAYHGEITISGLVAYTAPDVELPAVATEPDPLVADDLDGAEWTFAVMSDAQFVGESPDSAIVASARRTLREIKDSEADFLIVNGDLVDECEADDLALAERVLDEELGDDLEWVYVPGNHEVMGCDIADWSAVFGPARQTFDKGRTRFVTLDTSRLTVAGGGWEQILMLRETLDAAAADPDVDSVAVVAHVPPHDASPQQASQLGDRLEVAVVERWLSGFETESGKQAVYIGAHAGYFAADRVDGVSYWVNGNSGKAPHGTAADGGFIGWTEFGLGAGGDWLAAQVRPQVDALSVTAGAVPRGTAVQVEAALTQGDRVLPVAYPMGAAWAGSSEVYVGERPPGPMHWWRYDAWFDPETRELFAWRTGTVELTLTVNDVEAVGAFTVA
ncbi:phosphodiester glycosidase family protein [Glycomyces sp. TRM65418]|uniref:phosphodiester glycosidase family protein n=1 Tax=Glycomyces sp. TRM65418 TaxID=2867006 RepID=UPI001CE5A4E8|nr:phosphodiester glycosidase family protein [Glycomyces sp. TRM65418]MCC3761632.1 phosphodiester glycosidase family protein [Glycomyces sp. TRM65418]QZD55726.1 phosphodiester glycosidase family protein [Glycomyces sp. TRM65418]